MPTMVWVAFGFAAILISTLGLTSRRVQSKPLKVLLQVGIIIVFIAWYFFAIGYTAYENSKCMPFGC